MVGNFWSFCFAPGMVRNNKIYPILEWLEAFMKSTDDFSIHIVQIQTNQLAMKLA